jgi:hypothetical protein
MIISCTYYVINDLEYGVTIHASSASYASRHSTLPVSHLSSLLGISGTSHLADPAGLMVSTVNALVWSYGLHDKPQYPDYINILTSNRVFHFEAEDVYAPDEHNVSFMSFRNFSPLGGSGWLNNTSKPTMAFVSTVHGNPYGFPHRQTIAACSSQQVPLLLPTPKAYDLQHRQRQRAGTPGQAFIID